MKTEFHILFGLFGSSLALTQQQINWTYTQGRQMGYAQDSGSYLTYINSIGNCSFTLGVNTLYIYKLVPDDKEPLYHTYRGAGFCLQRVLSYRKASI